VSPRILIAVFLGTAVFAEVEPHTKLQVDVKLILIPVGVTDARDRPITNLRREHFQLFEDGVEQRITHFYREDTPVSLAVVFDSSGSMSAQLKQSVETAARVLKAAEYGDEFSLIRFSATPEVSTGFTDNPREIQNQLQFVRAKGRTALNDAIYLALAQLKSAKNTRKAMLVLTDGDDNASRHRPIEIQRLVREADVRVYAIGMVDFPQMLEILTRESGGRLYPVSESNEIRAAVTRVCAELRSQYVLGYLSSTESNDGKYHKVRVKVQRPAETPEIFVTWRRGYYATMP
jgi:Ca-activated chloride channel homolog